MTDSFQKIKDYLLTDPECKTVHKIIWDDVAYITTPWMVRIAITANFPLDEVKRVVARINDFNSETRELEMSYNNKK